MFSELDLPITVEEILKAISQLSNGKSSGSGRLLNGFFINVKEILTPYFHILFNKIFLSGYFPEAWSVGEIIPLHKKGD